MEGRLIEAARGRVVAALAARFRDLDLAEEADRQNQPLPGAYWRYLRIWTLLGIPAFVGLVVVFYLMVAKPA